MSVLDHDARDAEEPSLWLRMDLKGCKLPGDTFDFLHAEHGEDR